MGDAPTFSVVIPCYNYGHYLEETLQSVFDQNSSAVEIILVDDASSDDTPEIAAKYQDRIQYIRNETNLGAGGAWCVGLLRATGQFVMKLDADDKLLPGFFTAVRAAFEKDDSVGIVITSVLLDRVHRGDVKPQFVTPEDQILSATQFRDRFIRSFFFRVPGCMVRRSILEKHDPPDPDLYQIHDWEYLLRVTNGHGAALIHQPLAQYRIHDRSITATAQSQNRLWKDIKRWMEIAAQPGERNIGPQQLRVLKGSCAVLLLIGFGDKLKFKSYVDYLAKYCKAIRLAAEGGFSQMIRMHGKLLQLIFRHLTFSA